MSNNRQAASRLGEEIGAWRLDRVAVRWVPDFDRENIAEKLQRQSARDSLTVSCQLTLKLFGDVLAIEVWDPADGHAVQSPCLDLLAESGRGLAIVGQLCAAPLMVFVAPTCGKAVVALLARP